MQYFSIRNNQKLFNFKDIVTSGTAEDGGLYIPEFIPKIDKETLENWKKLSYIELATEIISLFATDIDKNDIQDCCRTAYSNFNTEILMLNKLEDNLYLLELFHGPTLSFKDYALQFLGQIVDLILSERQIKKQIITATSGDTGPAAIYGFKDCKWIDIKVYYPKNGVSKFQEEQMLLVKQNNVQVIGMECSFDKCQKLVKDEFASSQAGDLMTVNSINIGRIIAQIVYYFWTYLKLDQQNLNFYVPTGNFGNIFAGFLAKQMGIDINLNICVNENDTLYRFYQTGIYRPNKVISTLSNAIDIANPSNFERILWYLSDCKEDVIKYMHDLRNNGFYKVSDAFLQKFQDNFTVYYVRQSEMLKMQQTCLAKYNVRICPHTAIAMKSAIDMNDNRINICFATADWAKFR